MRIEVEFEIPKDPKKFAKILNTLANYLESNKMPPDHWTAYNRRIFYAEVYQNMSSKTCAMCRKLVLKKGK